MEKPELTYRDWDDLAFEGKNKDYGAYLLRKKYPRMLLKAFLAVAPFFVITVIAFQKWQREMPIRTSKSIGYTQYYGPALPPPPNPPKAKPITGARKRVIEKAEVPEVPPDNMVVEPKPDLPQIVDLLDREDKHPQDQYQSTVGVPLDAEIEDDYDIVSESRQGSTRFDEPDYEASYGALGSGDGFDLEKIRYYAVLVSDQGTNAIQWMVDSRDSVTTTRLNYLSNDVQDVFVSSKRHVDKGFGVYFVRVNRFQAVNLIWVRHIKDGRVYLFTGHVIDLEPKYDFDLRTHLRSFLDKYLFYIARMRKAESRQLR